MEGRCMDNCYFVINWVVSPITCRGFRVTEKLSWTTAFPQFPCSQLLGLVYKDIQIPHSHVGYIRLPTKEGLIRCLIPCSSAGGPIHGIHNSHKGISPEKVWGSSVLHNCSSFVEDLPVSPLSNTILFGCVRYGELNLILFSAQNLSSDTFTYSPP